jgi:Domain of unknown function (DUF6265)
LRLHACLSAALFLAAGCGAPAAQPSPGAAPDWLSGYWLSCESGRETVENWIGAGAGRLLGANLNPEGFEFLRIADNGRGGLSYFSMPDGSTLTEFEMASHQGQRVVFSNPSHDFPQRVIYERSGEALHARIEGQMQGRTESMDWNFRRAEADTRCPG